MIFVQNLINDSCGQIEKAQGQIVGTKMGSFVGNDQNTLLYDFMQKIEIKCRKVCNGPRDPFKWLVMQENTLNGFECKKIGDNNSKMCVCEMTRNKKKFERVFLGPK